LILSPGVYRNAGSSRYGKEIQDGYASFDKIAQGYFA
jgi:hypothetical protein